MKIQYGQLGLEFGRYVQIPAFLRDSRFELVSICSRNLQKTKKAAEDLKVPHHTSVPEELFKRVDVVAIALPPEEQIKYLPLALQHGCHVFLEKPLGRIDISKLMRVADQKIIVDLEFMEIDVFKKLGTIIKKGGLGDVSHIEVVWNVEIYSVAKRLKNWKTSGDNYGGALNNFGSHVLYYIEKLFTQVRDVFVQKVSQDGFADEAVFLQLRLESETLASINISTNAYKGSGHRIEVTGSLGSATLSNPSGSTVSDFLLDIKYKDGKSEAYQSNWVKKDGVDDRIDAVAEVVKNFGDAIEFGNTCEPSLEQAHRVEVLLEACRKSVKLRKIVTV